MYKQDTVTGQDCKSEFCYYYLHENGDLIHKSMHADPQDFEDNDLVKKWWKLDLTKRLDCYNFLIAAKIFGANQDRIDQLAKHWSFSDDDCQIYIEKVGLECIPDGNSFIVHGPNFVNMQESECGAGSTKFEAVTQFFLSCVNS